MLAVCDFSTDKDLNLGKGKTQVYRKRYCQSKYGFAYVSVRKCSMQTLQKLNLEEVKFRTSASKQLLTQWILYPSNSKCYHPFLFCFVFQTFSTLHYTFNHPLADFFFFFWFQILPLLFNSGYDSQTDHSQIPNSYQLLATEYNQVEIDI